MKASTKTPTVRPSAMGFIDASPSGMNAAKTATMMIAAAATTGAEAMKPSRTDAWGSRVIA